MAFSRKNPATSPTPSAAMKICITSPGFSGFPGVGGRIVSCAQHAADMLITHTATNPRETAGAEKKAARTLSMLNSRPGERGSAGVPEYRSTGISEYRRDQSAWTVASPRHAPCHRPLALQRSVRSSDWLLCRRLPKHLPVSNTSIRSKAPGYPNRPLNQIPIQVLAGGQR